MNEQRAREILGIPADANGPYALTYGTTWVMVDGPKASFQQREDYGGEEYTADQLEAIAWWMRNKPAEL